MSQDALNQGFRRGSHSPSVASILGKRGDTARRSRYSIDDNRESFGDTYGARHAQPE